MSRRLQGGLRFASPAHPAPPLTLAGDTRSVRWLVSKLDGVSSQGGRLVRCGALPVVVLLIVCLLPSGAEGLVAWGARAGLSLAGQDFDPPIDGIEGRSGLQVSLYAVTAESDRLRVVVDLAYVQKGMTYVVIQTDPDSEEEFDNRLDYLSIGVLYQADLRGVSPVPYMGFGPRLDFLIGHDAHVLFKSLYEKADAVDVGVDIVGGVRVGHALLEARYSMVIGESSSIDDLNVTNGAIQLLVGVEF